MSQPTHVVIVGGAPIRRALEHEATIRSADVLVAVDAGAELCRVIGRTPDHLVGDMDSVTAATLSEAEHAGALVHRLDSRKDYSDLDAALELCDGLSLGPPLTLTAVTGGRSDHFLGVCGSLARHARMEPAVVEPDMAAWILDSQGRASVSLAPAGTLFSVVALLGPARVSIAGARYPLAAVEIETLSTRGLSNRVEEESATITAHSGTVVVFSLRDSGVPLLDDQDARVD